MAKNKSENMENEVAKEHAEDVKETVNEQEAVQENETQESVENAKQEGNDNETNDLDKQINEVREKYMRLFAEFENYKRRTSKERLELIKTASQDTIAALLPVIDDFDRAKKNADDPKSAEQFSEGVSLVYEKLKKTLANKGLKPMVSTGEDFDPEFHEAITEIPAPSEDLKGKIIDTVETGYFLNDKIIRYAKVVVGK